MTSLRSAGTPVRSATMVLPTRRRREIQPAAGAPSACSAMTFFSSRTGGFTNPASFVWFATIWSRSRSRHSIPACVPVLKTWIGMVSPLPMFPLRHVPPVHAVDDMRDGAGRDAVGRGQRPHRGAPLMLDADGAHVVGGELVGPPNLRPRLLSDPVMGGVEARRLVTVPPDLPRRPFAACHPPRRPRRRHFLSRHQHARVPRRVPALRPEPVPVAPLDALGEPEGQRADGRVDRHNSEPTWIRATSRAEARPW